MRLESCFFLLLNLAVSSAVSLPTVEMEIVDVDEHDNIKEDLTLDDIREPLNLQRSSILPGNNLWTSPVSYVLDSGLDLNAKGVIMRAFDQFRVKSCIDFKPHDSEDYYLKIQKLDGCWSYIGRVFANGQDLSIGADCEYIAIVEHEILHALGFYHEQSRFDRDNYVQIVYANIMTGREDNFRKVASNESTIHGTPYDYMSVMHYGKDAFTNGNGSTIITIDPKFQDVIGQRLEMSATDAKELNLLYSCNETVAFKFFCGFSNGTMCKMNRCSTNGSGWEVVTDIHGGPSSDHTSLPSGSGDNGQQKGYFVHASTASGQEGDSAKLETEVVKLNRGCNVQCLQFYYFHSGNESDELNIWIREFEDEQETTGTPRLMGQITGSPTSHWKLHHVSLNATKPLQVVFEARKGAGSSTGGFSVDDINLSETECPHVFIQIDDLENRLNTSSPRTRIYSPRQYSKDGYAYRVAAILDKPYVGMYVQLLSGEFDDQLQWPCLQRQMIFQLLDQTPNKQLQMSKQQTFISVGTQVTDSGILAWSNPRENGSPVFNDKDESVYGGPLWGYRRFTNVEELQSREFLKGGSAIFMFNFQDLTPLIRGTSLPCPQLRPVNITNPPQIWMKLHAQHVSPTTSPPSTTPVYRTYSTIHQPPTTDNRTSSTTHPTPTTDNRISTTTIPPPCTTIDDSIFCFCPGMVASPILTVLLASILLLQ